MTEVSMRCSQRSMTMLALTLGLTFCLATPKPALAGGLEGKWRVRVEPDEDARKAGEKSYDDTLIFKANKFVSEACKAHGFGEVEYEEDTRRFGPSTFKAEPKSEKAGSAKWTGTITAHEMVGEMVWTKQDGTEVRYSFKGSKS
jgi:hypothetical protein